MERPAERDDGAAVQAVRGEEHVKNGFMKGLQRYRCKACGLNFTDTPPRGMPLRVKVTAVLLYLSGLSMNRTAKLLGRVDAQRDDLDRAVRRSLRAEARAGGPCRRGRAGRDVALPKKKANKLWVWKARDRATGRIIDWELGGRDRATLERLLERLKRWGVRLYCTDDWAAYVEAIPQGRLYVGKEETHGIERDHSRQRHWLARFRRRTCVVSRAERMVDASIALFVRFGDSAGIGELLSMLA